MNYYLQLVVLENCPYSNAALELVKPLENKTNIIKVNQTNKENYKTNDISSFPQIYLKKYNSNGSLLLGGYTDLKSFYETFQNQPYSEKNVNEFLKKYNKWSKKSTLRLIQLIN